MVYFSKKDTHIGSDGTEYSDSKVSGSLSAARIIENENTKEHKCGKDNLVQVNPLLAKIVEVTTR